MRSALPGRARHIAPFPSELDETILFALVDRIEIGETKKTGSMRICDVKVFYRYVGNVDEALTSENRDVV